MDRGLHFGLQQVGLEERGDELDGGPAADLIDGNARRLRAPDAGRAIDASGDDLATVPAGRQADDTAVMPAEREDVVAGLGVPELDRPVVAGREQAIAPGKKRKGGDRCCVAIELAHELAA